MVRRFLLRRGDSGAADLVAGVAAGFVGAGSDWVWSAHVVSLLPSRFGGAWGNPLPIGNMLHHPICMTPRTASPVYRPGSRET